MSEYLTRGCGDTRLFREEIPVAAPEYTPVRKITRVFYPIVRQSGLKYVWKPNGEYYFVLNDKNSHVFLQPTELNEIFLHLERWRENAFLANGSAPEYNIPISKNESKMIAISLHKRDGDGLPYVSISLWFRNPRYKEEEYRPSPFGVYIYGRLALENFVSLKTAIEKKVASMSDFEAILRCAYATLAKGYDVFKARGGSQKSCMWMITNYLESVEEGQFREDWNKEVAFVIPFGYTVDPVDLLRFIKNQCYLQFEQYVREGYESI